MENPYLTKHSGAQTGSLRRGFQRDAVSSKAKNPEAPEA
jgi:hypothetical protein